MSSDELAGLPLNEFLWLLQGLSSRSRFQRAWADAPKHMYAPDEIAAVRAAAMR